jgi:hypothetical protein
MDDGIHPPLAEPVGQASLRCIDAHGLLRAKADRLSHTHHLVELAAGQQQPNIGIPGQRLADAFAEKSGAPENQDCVYGFAARLQDGGGR